jgi:hypothetical protein
LKAFQGNCFVVVFIILVVLHLFLLLEHTVDRYVRGCGVAYVRTQKHDTPNKAYTFYRRTMMYWSWTALTVKIHSEKREDQNRKVQYPSILLWANTLRSCVLTVGIF